MNDHELFRSFAEPPLPASTVDIDRAVRDGRRHRRRTHALTAMGLVVLVALGAVTAPRLTDLVPSGGRGTASPPGACPQARTPAGVEFDPLVRQIDLRGASRLELREYTTAVNWQRLELADPAGPRLAEIQLIGPHGTPMFGPPGEAPVSTDPAAGSPAGDIDGHPAYWLPGPQGLYQYEVARLGWEPRPGVWLFVAVGDTSGDTALDMDELRATALDLARSVTLGELAVRMPFTVPVPACTELTSASIVRGTAGGTAGGDRPFVRAGLAFGAGPVSVSPVSTPDAPDYTIVADTAARPDDKPGSVDRTVDGHPAAGLSSGVILYDLDGLALEVTAPGGVDEAVELSRRVSVIAGAADDESVWTDDPLVAN